MDWFIFCIIGLVIIIYFAVTQRWSAICLFICCALIYYIKDRRDDLIMQEEMQYARIPEGVVRKKYHMPDDPVEQPEQYGEQSVEQYNHENVYVSPLQNIANQYRNKY